MSRFFTWKDRLGRHFGFGFGWFGGCILFGKCVAWSLYLFKRRIAFRPIDYSRYE